VVPQYQQIRRDLERSAGHINGMYAAPDWVPIRYVNQSFPHSVLTGYYRNARVGFVTPLRDGMNLVAKEYVASQDPKDPGVLVLSRFAGAAFELPEALLINPADTAEVADTLERALKMPLKERKHRWRACRAERHLRRADHNSGLTLSFLRRQPDQAGEAPAALAVAPVRIKARVGERVEVAAVNLRYAGGAQSQTRQRRQIAQPMPDTGRHEACGSTRGELDKGRAHLFADFVRRGADARPQPRENVLPRRAQPG
jgi:hypothetical protein